MDLVGASHPFFLSFTSASICSQLRDSPLEPCRGPVPDTSPSLYLPPPPTTSPYNSSSTATFLGVAAGPAPPGALWTGERRLGATPARPGGGPCPSWLCAWPGPARPSLCLPVPLSQATHLRTGARFLEGKWGLRALRCWLPRDPRAGWSPAALGRRWPVSAGHRHGCWRRSVPAVLEDDVAGVHCVPAGAAQPASPRLLCVSLRASFPGGVSWEVGLGGPPRLPATPRHLLRSCPQPGAWQQLPPVGVPGPESLPWDTRVGALPPASDVGTRSAWPFREPGLE